MKLSVLTIGLAVLLLTLVVACSKREEPASAQKPAAKTQAAPAAPEAVKNIAKLKTYDDPNMPIRTEYPDIMKVEATASGEGSGFFFTFKPQGTALDRAKVHLFLPRGAATAADQEPFVVGPNGLLKSNGWKMEGESTDTNQGMVGKILLGEANGQAVQVILYYPGDMNKDFLIDANLILGKLHFKSDKLPLGKSH